VLKQEHLLNCLAELFYSIVTMKKKKGIIQPKKFIARLRKDNDAFDNLFQQDAHEFLNYLLNTCADLLKAEMKELKELKKLEEQNRLNESSVRLSTKTHKNLHGKLSSSNNTNGQPNGAPGSNSNNRNSTGYNSSSKQRNNSRNGSSRSLNSQNSINSNSKSSNNDNQNNFDDLNRINLLDSSSSNDNKEELTWIHELFQGILVNETKCLNCETVSSLDFYEKVFCFFL
jgi:ubiquitin C-terminal hydrolase